MLWLLATIAISMFMFFYLIPRLKRKSMLYKASRKLVKMSKEHEGETKQQFLDLAAALKEAAKNGGFEDEL